MKAKARNPERFAVLLLCTVGGLVACSEKGQAAPAFVLHDTQGDRACRIDADCTAVHLPCRGWQPVRRDRAAVVEARYSHDNRDELRRSDCAGPGDAPLPVSACTANACTLASAAAPAAGER